MTVHVLLYFTLNVTSSDISVIHVTEHGCAGELKKFPHGDLGVSPATEMKLFLEITRFGPGSVLGWAR